MGHVTMTGDDRGNRDALLSEIRELRDGLTFQN
jgi:hypothetical protein